MSVVQSETVSVTETVKTTVNDGTMYKRNGELVKYLLFLFIVFLIVIIIANNPDSIYFTLTKPDWSSLTTWTVFFAIVLFLSGFALCKCDDAIDMYKSGGFKFLMFVSLFLIVLGIFFLFRTTSTRVCFWLFIAALIVTVISLFFIGGISRSCALWTLPLLIFEVVGSIYLWQIIQLNNL
jgi:tryptophan-rich sensory protein